MGPSGHPCSGSDPVGLLPPPPPPLRGRPSSWSWDLTLAGTDSRYQVGTLPVLGIFSTPLTPKTPLLPPSSPGLTELQDWKVSQPASTFAGRGHGAPGLWQLAAGGTTDPGPLTKPHGWGGHAQGHTAVVGEMCLKTKTTSSVRTPCLHGSPPGPRHCLPQTWGGGVFVRPGTDGHGVAMEALPERKMRELGAEDQCIWKETTFMWLTDN